MAPSESLTYWATISYHRWWLGFDQIEHQLLVETCGKLTPESVRRIAKRYQVNRGIRAPNSKDAADESAIWLARYLNEEICRWPDTIRERQQFCVDVADKAANTSMGDGRSVTRGKLVSGISKLSWFLKPEGWTLFDRLAADALGVRICNNIDRSNLFYAELQKQGFEELANNANESIDRDRYPAFYAERILDHCLLLKKSPPTQELEAYLLGLGIHERNELVDMACRISSVVGDQPLVGS